MARMSSPEDAPPPAPPVITKKRLVIAASALVLIAAALALGLTVGKRDGQQGSAQGKATTKLGAGSKPASDPELSDVVGPLLPLGPISQNYPSVSVSTGASPTKLPGQLPAPAPSKDGGEKGKGWFRGDVFGARDKHSDDHDHDHDHEGWDTVCSVADVEELTDAVYDHECPTIHLTNGSREAYLLQVELNITRTLTIVGHPMVLPHIDGGEVERCFRVKPGGKLTLQFMRVHQGGGFVRERYVRRPNPNSLITEVQGGAVFVEDGAEGLTAQGVMFLSIANTVNSVIAGWQNTLNQIGGRVYGGHILAMGGNNSEWDCPSPPLVHSSSMRHRGHWMCITSGEE
jgi:hypothetical protein